MADKLLAYIGLGSNMDEPEQQLTQATKAISALPLSQIEALSPWYETAAVGNTQQANFINAVLSLRTTLSALELLQALQTIETQQGRTRKERWGPRCIDLDLLIYDTQQWRSKQLWLPHPRMSERKFVLQPLYDIAPNLQIGRQSINECISTCNDQEVSLLKPSKTSEALYAR